MFKSYKGKKKIDPVTVIEFLNKDYIFADRTVIQGIHRTPWLAKPNNSLNKWEYYTVPKHGETDVSEEKIAKTLFQKICLEIKTYIGDKKKIGILLSGGMDSRMVAGALDYLIKTNILLGLEVTGLTWGDHGTRDVVYAKEIASRLNWKWKHYTVTAKDLLNNINETAIHGCEYSPIHLHAIPQIRDDNKLDIILAGSYGDSIGRAEYQGKKVNKLRPLLSNISNGGIVNKKVFNASMKDIVNDIERYHDQFPVKALYMQNELDYQLHYMRRCLNPCMELLTIKTDFCQVFTHPDVYGYMWSINPVKRNDSIYKYMLEEFITKLSDIPWARTGLPYGQENGTPDYLKKDHHSYVKIIRKEIFDKIIDLLMSKEIKQLGVVNQKHIKVLIKLVWYLPRRDLYYIDKLVWLASLAKMSKIYSIKGLGSTKWSTSTFCTGIISISFEYMFNYVKNIVAVTLRKYKLM